MSYYRTCPDCGAHLDPGEICDCKDTEGARVTGTDALGKDKKRKDLKS